MSHGMIYPVVSFLSGTTTPRGAAPFKEPEGKPARGERTPSSGASWAPRQSPLNRAALEASRSSHSAMEDDARRPEENASGARKKDREAPRERAPEVVKDPRKHRAGKRSEWAKGWKVGGEREIVITLSLLPP